MLIGSYVGNEVVKNSSVEEKGTCVEQVYKNLSRCVRSIKGHTGIEEIGAGPMEIWNDDIRRHSEYDSNEESSLLGFLNYKTKDRTDG